jgi:uncharacterized cupin superfamily protein
MKLTNIATPEFEYDSEDPDGFRAGMARLGEALGAKESGATVYELAPGQAVCPYHYEVAEEEWLLVLAGTPTLRHPEGSEKLAPWDVACFPRGPEGAHKIANETGENARVLMFSTVTTPTATVYPDSGKVGIWTGDPATETIVKGESGAGYYDGEADA